MYKLKQVMWHMKEQNISIMCIQETHVRELAVFKESAFLVILSGSTEINTAPFYAGVGFIIFFLYESQFQNEYNPNEFNIK